MTRLGAQVVSVADDTAVDQLAVGIAGGVTTLVLEDAIAFNEGGGTLRLDWDEPNSATTYTWTGTYTSADRVTNVITLAAGPPSGWPIGTQVRPLPEQIVRTAFVRPYNSEEGELIAARVPFSLRDRVPPGERIDQSGETVELEELGLSFVIADVLGAIPVLDGELIDPDTLPEPTPPDPTDGLPPASSPAATSYVPDIPRTIRIEWLETANADALVYDVYRHTSGSFTPPGTGTKVVTTAATVFVDTSVTGGTGYYYRIIARDADGSAAPGTVSALATALAGGTDGSPPASSPAATATVPNLARTISVTWPEVANADQTTYDLYRHTSSPFTPPGVGTLVFSGSSTAFTDFGVVGGTAYFYRVIARDPDGSAAPGVVSASATAKSSSTDGTAPSSSPAATATAPNLARTINVSWPEIANADAVTYDLYRHTSTPFTPPGAGTKVVTTSATAFVDTSVAGGTGYYYRVIARDLDGSAGPGTVSALATARTGGTDGSAPASSPAAVATVPNQARTVSVTWAEVANADPVTYDIYRHTSSPFTPPGVGTLVYSGSGTAFLDTSVLGGTAYYYRIIARDPDGSAAVGVVSSVATPRTATTDAAAPGSSPAATATVPNLARTINVSWPEVANADPVSYDLYRHTSSGFTPPGTGTKVATTSGTTFVDTTVIGGTGYYYRLIARDTDGSAAPGTQSALATARGGGTDGSAPASSPAAVITVPSIAKTVAVQWAEVANNDPVTYDLYRHTASGFTPPGTGTLVFSGSGTAYTDFGVVAGTSYWYRVIARDPDGSAAPGTQSAVAVPKSSMSDGAAPTSSPAAIATVPNLARTINISWAEVANADPVTYDLYRHTTNSYVPPGTGTLVFTGVATKFVDTTAATSTTYYYRVIARDADGSAAPGTVSAGVLAKAFVSDGAAPSSSPTPEVHGGVGYLAVRWTAAANPDPLTYDIHVSPTAAFTPSAGTLVGSVQGTLFFINRLADDTPLTYLDTAGAPVLYYIRLVARDEDGSAAASTEVSGSMTQVTTSDIAVNTITAQQMYAGSLSTQHLGAVDAVISTLVAGDPSSQHVIIDADGLRVITAAGETLVDLPTDPNKRPKFDGDLIAQNLEVLGATLLGQTTIASGTTVSLVSTVSAPSSSPTVGITYPAPTARLGSTYRYPWFGLAYTATGGVGANTPCWYTSRPNSGGYYRFIDEYRVSDGVLLRTITLPNTDDDCWGITICAGWFFVLFQRWGAPAGSDYRIHRYTFTDNWAAPSPLVASGVRQGVLEGEKPGLGTDGTNVYVMGGDTNTSPSNIRYLRYSPSTLGYLGGSTQNALSVDTRDSSGRSTEFGGFIKVGSTYYLAVYSYDAANIVRRSVFAFTGNPDIGNGLTLAPDEHFQGGLGQEADGITHDGTNFFTVLADELAPYKHTNWTWTVSDSSTYWVGHTWRDDTGTGEGSAAGNLHETVIGPRTQIAMRKRAALSVSTTAVPPGGGPDDPNARRIYMNRGSSEPQSGGRFNGLLQVTPTGMNWVLTNFTLGGQQNPAASSFPGGVPARIDTQSPAHADLVANGDGFQPIGAIQLFAGATAPLGWILCQGQSLLRTEYAALFSVIGTTFGAVDGTHFTLPDLRSRVPVGVGTFGALAAADGLAETARNVAHDHAAGTLGANAHAANTDSPTSGGSTRITQVAHTITGTTGTRATSAVVPWLALNYIIKT